MPGWECGEFQNGIVPEWDMVTEKALVKILWGLGEGGVLYWELLDCDRDGVWLHRC